MILGAISLEIKRLARSGLANLLVAALTDRSLVASVNTPVGIDIWLTLQSGRQIVTFWPGSHLAQPAKVTHGQMRSVVVL